MKTIVVTGAAGGIGRAIVERLAQEGLSILACDRDADALEKLVEQFPKAEIETAAFDCSEPEAVEAFGLKLKKKAPHLYGLVNNAGVYLGQDLFDYKIEKMDQVMAINLLAPILISQAFGRVMVKAEKPGVVVNVSSISAFEGSSDALYGATKAGLIGLTKSCAITFAPLIRVNAVAPGLVDTTMIAKIPDWRLAEFEKSERLKGGRISPAAVAAAVWFLLSDESRHTTGSVIDLNNGGYFR